MGPEFSLSKCLSYIAEAGYADAPAAVAWLPMGSAELLRGDAKVLTLLTRRLWQADLCPRLIIHQSAVLSDSIKYLQLKCEIELEHIAAGSDPTLDRARNVYFGILQVITHFDALEALLEELEMEAQIDADKALALKEIANSWRNGQCDSTGQIGSDNTFASPGRQSEKAQFKALSDHYGEWATFLKNYGSHICAMRLDEAFFRLEIPSPIAGEVVAADETVAVKQAPLPAEKKKSNLLGQSRIWFQALFYLLAASAVVAALAAVSWFVWLHSMQFHPKTQDPQLLMVSEIYNGQQLYLDKRARELVMQSPGVFEDYIVELDRLTRFAPNINEYRQLTDALDTYRDAWVFRRNLYEQALRLTDELSFEIQPVQQIKLGTEEQEVSIVLDHLDMREDPKLEVIKALRARWQTTQVVVKRINSMRDRLAASA